MARIRDLLRTRSGPAFVGFDFPFGYPAGSGLGGGRKAAAIIASDLVSDELDANNRFDVAGRLNEQISPHHPGPFWGCPPSSQSDQLTSKKPPFLQENFKEWRIVEKHLRDNKKQTTISAVWKLYTIGSVGSQTLTGLKCLHDLGGDPEFAMATRYWPFETRWDADLDGIILTEIWPSLNAHDTYDHAIKDARQVLACRDWFIDHQRAGTAKALFAAPDWLSRQEQEKCRTEEGWILGVR
ncbi:MAG: hypothetical protein COB93_09815 [Sneathiella sp.]|nr:MAG: hypothetical protein COB93_09815 [Sneathiella sp.]